MTKIKNYTQRNNLGNPPNEVSHLTVSIFQHYYDEQVKPFQKHLTRKYKRLQNLYELDRFELPEKDEKQIRYLESEIRDSYQAFIAMDELKSIYSDHYQQLHQSFLGMKDFAEREFRRAESWLDLWEKAQVRLKKLESLLVCSTEEELKELERRRDEKRLDRMVRVFIEGERPISNMLKARKNNCEQLKTVEAW